MELIANPSPDQLIHHENVPSNIARTNFIEANTEKVTLEHLANDCIIPVFSKDNESTISHAQFIQQVQGSIEEIFDGQKIMQPDIRVSHIVKGRIPSAVGKPAKELLEHEKTIYYERCAFVIEIPSIRTVVKGNELNLSVGGVRAYNQENLYSRKTLEKFKLFIGFQNRVCTNLCVSTDGFSNQIRVGSVDELDHKMKELVLEYNMENHIEGLNDLADYSITEVQFAHLIGKLRMFQHLDKETSKNLFPMMMNDGQVSNVVKDYYSCPNFGRNNDGSIDLWHLYNLFTESNKSSYIDSAIERNVNSYALVNHLQICLKNNLESWLLI